jgi:putative transposase
LCKLFGKTRHAYYDQQWRNQDQYILDDWILQLVKETRGKLKKCGTRQLYVIINQRLHAGGMKVGRDYLFQLLSDYKLLIRRRKRRVITTDSRHWMKKYPNLIVGLQPNRPDQLWVSDITYIPTSGGYCYLSLITDVYSHKIVGYHLSEDLTVQGCLIALKSALEQRRYLSESLIHHSDRGSQYCSSEYVQLLKNNNIAISMTSPASPGENSVAERMNGILKWDFDLYSNVLDFKQTALRVKESIELYNQLRPHSSCDYLTPEEAHKLTGPLTKRWKTYTRKTLSKPIS